MYQRYDAIMLYFRSLTVLLFEVDAKFANSFKRRRKQRMIRISFRKNSLHTNFQFSFFLIRIFFCLSLLFVIFPLWTEKKLLFKSAYRCAIWCGILLISVNFLKLSFQNFLIHLLRKTSPKYEKKEKNFSLSHRFSYTKNHRKIFK